MVGHNDFRRELDDPRMVTEDQIEQWEDVLEECQNNIARCNPTGITFSIRPGPATKARVSGASIS